MTYTPTIKIKSKNYIAWDIPNTESSFTYALIEYSQQQSANFTGLTSQSITNNTFFDASGSLSSYWYKLRFFDDTNKIYSSYTDSFQTDDEYYCTARDVASFMGRTQFTDSTNPTRFEVEDIISEICDEIDKVTHHAWRKVRVSNEYYNVRIQDRYASYRGAYPYDYATRVQLSLKHRSIHSFIPGTTKIEVWNGNLWEDFVVSYTEGRAQDYWIDYNRGVIYFVNKYPLWSKANVRITYDYGESIVPGDIKKAAVMMSAAQILAKEDLNVVYPASTMGSVLEPRERWEKWNEMAQKILEKRTEILGMRYY